MIDTVTRIETPEGVRLTFRTAGIAVRGAAAAIDVVVRMSVLTALHAILGFLSIDGDSFLAEIGGGVLLLVFFISEWVYGTAFEWLWSGRTPGKRILDLRVVRVDGGVIRFTDAVIRNLLRAADAMPVLGILPCYSIGAASCFITQRQQRVGDILAGTFVVQERKARLRRRVTLPASAIPFAWGEIQYTRAPGPRVLHLIDRLIRRSRQLPSARAREVAAILAVPLAQRLGYHASVGDPVSFLQRVFASFADGAMPTADPARRQHPAAPAAAEAPPPPANPAVEPPTQGSAVTSPVIPPAAP